MEWLSSKCGRTIAKREKVQLHLHGFDRLALFSFCFIFRHSTERGVFYINGPFSLTFFSSSVSSLLVTRSKMQFSKIAVPAAIASVVAAGNVTVTTNVVVTDFVTYCPEATTLVVNNKTITVTEATTLTITGPCTIPTTYVTSAPVESSTVAAVSTAFNGAGKVAVGAAAGVAAVAAALF